MKKQKPKLRPIISPYSNHQYFFEIVECKNVKDIHLYFYKPNIFNFYKKPTIIYSELDILDVNEGITDYDVAGYTVAQYEFFIEGSRKRIGDILDE